MLVLFSVLGTMVLLGIPYTLVTSIITALSIGIGVDYTIHVIHRYREEFAHVRNPERRSGPSLRPVWRCWALRSRRRLDSEC